jgi:hypothetical protein
MAEGRSIDADGERANADCSVGDDEIEITAVQAAFPRKVTAEIEGVVAGLEADKVVFAKRRSGGVNDRNPNAAADPGRIERHRLIVTTDPQVDV